MTRTRIKPWMVVSAVWLWPAVLSVLERLVQTRLSGWDAPSAQDLLFSAGDWLLYAAVTPIIFAISERWPVVRPRSAQRLLIHFGFALFFCFVWAVVGKLFQLGLALVIDRAAVQAAMEKAGDGLAREVVRNVLSWIFTTLPFGVVVYGTVAGIAHAISYFVEARDREVQIAKMSEQLTSARYAALQSQLNPHFLFNTLNTVTVLVRDGDREGAVGVIEHLSEVLRRTLNRHQANEVSLGEELELVQQYLAIEQARFSDRLRAEIDIDPSLYSLAIPSFALQHLVENALRHGIARRADAGLLRVTAARERSDGARDGEKDVGSADTLVLTVEDDGVGVPADLTFATGHGLANTRERLHALHGDRASLTLVSSSSGGARATLRIPARELPSMETDAVR